MIIVSPAKDNNRWVSSSNTSYGSALNGSSLTVDDETFARMGQAHHTSDNRYYVRQYFVEYGYSLLPGQLPVAGHFYIRNQNTFGSNRKRNLEMRETTWSGATPTTAAFRTPSQLGSSTMVGLSNGLDDAGNNTNLYVGIRQVQGQFGVSGDKRYVLASSRNRLQNSPVRGEREDNTFSSVSFTVADQRPRVVVGATTENMMHPFLAAQIQLTDGSWAMLEKTNMDRSDFQLQMRRIRPDGSSHLIWGPLPSHSFSGTDNMRGTHSYTMARDDNDTIFLCHSSYNSTDSLEVRALTKVGGESWNAQPARVVKLPEEDGNANIQAVQMTYHAVAGGRLVIVAFFDWGNLGGTQESYSLVSTASVVSGSGTLVLSQGRGGEKGFTAYPANPGRWNALNSTGTLFDMHEDSGSAFRGFIVSAERHGILGATNSLSIGRYNIHSNGDQFNSNTFSELDVNGGWAQYDPDAKCRVLGTSQSGGFVKVTVDPRQERGVTVDAMAVGDNNTMVRLNTTRYDSPEIDVPSLPEGIDLAHKMTWDAVYFQPDNSVWIYYFDKDNPRRLMRTAYRVGTYQAQQNEVEVVAELATSGHTIHAIRVQRNKVTDDNVLITASTEDGSGVHGYVYHVDRINVAPTQPTLIRVPNYDADDDQDFSWIFRDGNFSDVQSAYQIQIVTQVDASTVLDTGKVVGSDSTSTVPGGTVPNNENLMWRVRTWDSVDVMSPWSEYSVFATSNSGIISVVHPSMDNDPDIFTNDITIEWEIEDADQDEYRVTLMRTEDNSVFYDSGWISSSEKEHYIPSIESDVEYLVTVRARMSMVESAPGYRLLTSHYSTVEEPIISIQVHPEYLVVSVVNPEPRGDRPNPNINRIYRRVAGSAGLFKYVGSCLPNDTFRDYDVASDALYEYKVRAGVEL